MRHLWALTVISCTLAFPLAAFAAPSELSEAIAAFERSGDVLTEEEVGGILLVALPEEGASTSSEAAPDEPPAAGGDANELAKKMANPVADLISIPFEFNYDEGNGPRDIDFWTLKVQPVVPIGLSDDWNLITRVITPFYWRQAPTETTHYESGLGDITPSFFFSPKEPTNGWIWGVGPAFLLPTATNSDLGAKKWSAGPTIVALRQDGPWTVGLLANHLWSFAGKSERDSVNATYLQPFAAYLVWKGATVVLSSESTCDWHNGEWTVPVNLMLKQIVPIGRVPVQFFVGVRYYFDTPEFGPEWGLRFGFAILLPK